MKELVDIERMHDGHWQWCSRVREDRVPEELARLRAWGWKVRRRMTYYRAGCWKG